jgi:hypothetical protein
MIFGKYKLERSLGNGTWLSIMIIQIPRRSFPLRPALPLICPIEPQTQTQPNKHPQKRSKVQILPSDVIIKYMIENFESCYIPLYDSVRNLGYENHSLPGWKLKLGTSLF